jgi:DNA-3-methyladenine glycosylase
MKAIMRSKIKPLPESFFARDTATVAKELLGKKLIRYIKNHRTVCRVIETEAYYGSNDPASHAARGKTPRSSIMFGPPAVAYVYFNYGVHYLFNVVTEKEGVAGAVLIRALEPLEGIEQLLANRPVKQIEQLTSGPGKLTQALSITSKDNGSSLLGSSFCFSESDYQHFSIEQAPRIGISNGQHLLLRFYISGNKFVSQSRRSSNKTSTEGGRS